MLVMAPDERVSEWEKPERKVGETHAFEVYLLPLKSLCVPHKLKHV